MCQKFPSDTFFSSRTIRNADVAIVELLSEVWELNEYVPSDPPTGDVELDTPLLQQSPADAVNAQKRPFLRHARCLNNGKTPFLYNVHQLTKRNHPSFCPGRLLFANLWWITSRAGIHSCANAECDRKKQLLSKSTPPCRWDAFTDLILTVLACSIWQFLRDVSLNIRYSISQGDEGPAEAAFSCVDIAGVIDVFHWAAHIAQSTMTEHLYMNPESGKVSRKYDFEEMPRDHETFHTLVDRAFLTRGESVLNQYNVVAACPQRFWNLAKVCKRGTVDLPHIAAVALSFDPEVGVRGHQDCTEQRCFVGSENTTLVRQMHKCSDGNCEAAPIFSPQLLNEIYQDSAKILQEQGKSGYLLVSDVWRQTAWSIQSLLKSPCLSEVNDEYMALSHVWVDGTGDGRKSPGEVNSCLIEFFKGIAKDLDCTGLWWDTISLPTAKAPRTAAMSIMLENYRRAKVTVVHDKALTDFVWRDDGSPAVALVLSTWFSRGWTAAELYASRGHAVKVLFKNPDQDGPPFVMKDLDTEILAFDTWSIHNVSDEWYPADIEENSSIALFRQAQSSLKGLDHVPTLGYYIASGAIQQLRKNRCLLSQQRYLTLSGAPRRIAGLTYIEELLRIMRGRTTSWHRDELLIAGLMFLDDPFPITNATGAEITQRIMKRYRSIRIVDLYHAEMPINMPVNGSGRWQWCPPSIYSFGHYGQDTSVTDRCDIDFNGDMSGIFQAWPLSEEYVAVPVATHPAVIRTVQQACLEPAKCLLLSHRFDDRISQGQLHNRVFILVVAMRHHWRGWSPLKRVSCGWIGCVHIQGWRSETEFKRAGLTVKAYFSLHNHFQPAVESIEELDLDFDGENAGNRAKRVQNLDGEYSLDGASGEG